MRERGEALSGWDGAAVWLGWDVHGCCAPFREAFTIPLIPLGLKETKDVDFSVALKVNLKAVCARGGVEDGNGRIVCLFAVNSVSMGPVSPLWLAARGAWMLALVIADHPELLGGWRGWIGIPA